MPDQPPNDPNLARRQRQAIWSDLRRLECLRDLLEQASIPLQQVMQLLTDANKSDASEIGRTLDPFRKWYGSMFLEFSHLQAMAMHLHTSGERIIQNTLTTKLKDGLTESESFPEPPPATSSTPTAPRSASDAPSGEKSNPPSAWDIYKLLKELRTEVNQRLEKQEAEETFQSYLPHLHGPNSGL